MNTAGLSPTRAPFKTPRMTKTFFANVLRRRGRNWWLALLGGALALAGFLGTAEWIVTQNASDRIADVAVDASPADVGLVLGTARTVNGRANWFYEARLNAAAELFRTGRVRALLVSGDNSHRDYDEPSDMKRDLVARGVPEKFITCDYAGFSTLDSVQRAKRVFGLQRIVVVSQRFHVERALFLADAAGLEAHGLAAADAPRFWAVRTRIREVASRGKVVFDVALARDPKFLGQPETVLLAGMPAALSTP